ncbi:MAG: hypothetical protein ACI8ZN_000769 [Bacteroidia bacterium]|jgi:hypothetical protein
MKKFQRIAKPYLLALLTFIAVSTLYFLPQLEGKVVQQSDIQQFKGMAQETIDFRDKSGESSLWTNSMFGGMPTYQIMAAQPGNLITYVSKLYSLFLTRPIGYFFSLMLGFYIMLLCFGVKNWMAVVGAIAFAFSTNNFVLFDAGHVTKLRTISTIPLIIGGLQLFVDKKWKLGCGVFLLGFALNIHSNHYQMTYYFLLTLLIWAIIYTIDWVKKKEFATLGKASLCAVGGLLLSLGCSAALLINTYVYSKDTMRGDPILKATEAEVVNTDNAMSSSKTKGLSWTYAMQWSNGVADLGSAIIPGFVGGSSNEIMKKDGEAHKLFKQSGQPMRRSDGHYQGPLYWGNLPFTSGPVYFGAIMCFLFVLGLFNVKGSIKWWILIVVVLTFLLSLGKNFEMLQRLFFDHFPMYNKFRTPSSILSVTAIFIPLLGILGLKTFMDDVQSGSKDKTFAAWLNLRTAAVITGGFCLSAAIFGSAALNFMGAGDFDATGKLVYDQKVMDVFIGERRSLFQTDAFRSAFFILAAAGLMWALVKKKLKTEYVLAGVALLVTIDMWGVGKRYLGENSFVNANKVNRAFQERPADQQILSVESNRGAYRVLDLTGNPFSSSYTSYFHNSIGGYHAAKLQRYQDMIDNHFSKSLNLGVMNMLNTKYIISEKGELQTNLQAYGNAWLIKGIQPVSTPRAEIDSTGTINVRDTAVVNVADFEGVNAGKTYTGNGTITMMEYKPNKLTYESESAEEQMAVFSEIWFGPNKGWNASINGNPVDHIRANYILRALELPAGKNTIVFEFNPKSYKRNNLISLASSLAVIVLSVLIFGGAIRDELNKKEPLKA